MILLLLSLVTNDLEPFYVFITYLFGGEFYNFLFHFCLVWCVCVCVYGVHVEIRGLWKLVLSFLHVCPRDQT